MYVMKPVYETLYETDIFYYLRQTYKINLQKTKHENNILIELMHSSSNSFLLINPCQKVSKHSTAS